MIPIIIAILLVIFTAVILKTIFGRSKGNTIILMGLDGSGKTAVFGQLISGKDFQTHTSLVENKGDLPNSSLALVDIPGNPRLRTNIFAKYSGSVRGIVVVVDSADFADRVRDCTEVLYEVLISKDVQKSKSPVLLFCNKQDEEMARGPMPIRTAIERELTTLNNTAGSTLTDDSGSVRTLAPINSTIKLDKLNNLVTAVGGVGKGENPDISSITDWIEQL